MDDTGQLWTSLTSIDIILVLTCFVLLTTLSYLVDVFPSTVRCFFKLKEHENLCSSASFSHSRNIACTAMILPAVIIAARFRLWPPLNGQDSFWATLEPLWCILVTLGIFVCYVVIRLMMLSLAKRMTGRTVLKDNFWKCAAGIPLNLFILLSTIMVVSAFVMMLTGMATATIRTVLLWEIAVTYFTILIQSFHFFKVYRNFFSAFLYLCTLEILPSGLLVLSAILL